MELFTSLLIGLLLIILVIVGLTISYAATALGAITYKDSKKINRKNQK